MKAVLISEDTNKIVELKDIPEPKIFGDDEVVVEITYCSLCHSDLSLANGDWGTREIGESVGHENVGHIVKVGKNVTNVKIGDNVAFAAGLHNACGKCKFCLAGEEVFCDEVRFGPVQSEGTMQKYTVEKGAFCTKLPDNIDLPKASVVTCAGVTVYKALKIAHIRLGEWVAIYGIGGLGNMAIEYAKNVFQAKVIAVGSNKDSLAIAKVKGADAIINWKEQDLATEISKITDGKGVDVALQTSSSIKLFQQSYDTLGKMGRLSIVGLPSSGALQVPIYDLIMNGKQVLGSLIGTRQDLIEAIGYLAEGKVNPELEVVSIDEAEKYFKLMSEGKLFKRIVFDFQD